MQINCPNCGESIEYEDYLQGECPECHCKFEKATEEGTVDDTAVPAPEPAPDVAAEAAPPARRQYRWGRRYISWSRWVAWLMAIVCILLTALILWNGLSEAYEARRKAFQEAAELEARLDAKTLQKQQQAAVDNFNNMTALLSDTSNGKGPLLKLPDALMFKTYAFPESYDTLAQIVQAQGETKNMERDVATIKEGVATMLAGCLQALQRQFQQSQLSASVKTAGASQRSILVTPGINRQFYSDEVEPQMRDVLDMMANLAEEVSQNADANAKTRMEMGTLVARLDYIADNLLSKEAKTVTRSAAETRPQETTVSRRSGGYNFAQELANLARVPAIVTSGWKIDELLADLQKSLEGARTLLGNASTLRTEAQRRFHQQVISCAKEAGCQLFYGLAAAFLVLVFADYLQAHFDTADNTTKSVDLLER